MQWRPRRTFCEAIRSSPDAMATTPVSAPAPEATIRPCRFVRLTVPPANVSRPPSAMENVAYVSAKPVPVPS